MAENSATIEQHNMKDSTFYIYSIMVFNEQTGTHALLCKTKITYNIEVGVSTTYFPPVH